MAGQHPSFCAACIGVAAGTRQVQPQISTREAAVVDSAEQVINAAACPMHCLHMEAGGSRCLHGRRGSTLIGRWNA
jgi:hypothetical protein